MPMKIVDIYDGNKLISHQEIIRNGKFRISERDFVKQALKTLVDDRVDHETILKARFEVRDA